ncbi:MAG TPA: RagB/SusD family nutrient uptake outer membrane protein [Bacteroidales bacterium]
MNNKFSISAIFLVSVMMIVSSCTKDLNVTPIDPSVITSGNIATSKSQVEGALAKVYASFAIAGQNGSTSTSGADITTNDDNFNTTFRAMWNLQELTTDEAACAWGDPGIADLNKQTWANSNPFLTALYDRLVLSVTYANSVINLTKSSNDADFIKYNAEARFLRAMAYYYAIDMFGNPPFITENSPIGPVFPSQIDPDLTKARPMLFNYIVKDLHDIAYKLGDPGFSYPRADRASCWMLLSKLYLNAKVYTGTAKWDSCKLYCDSVINCGKYQLAKNYRQNFGSNNDYPENPEMILGWAYDGIYTQGYIGSTFLIESCSNGTYIDANKLGLHTNTNWGGNRGKIQLLNELVDTLTIYASNGGKIPTPANHIDSIFAQSPDQRVYLWTLQSNQMYSTSQYIQGIGVYKFTNNQVNDAYSVGGKNDTIHAPNYNSAYSSTDIPVFRLADAYLMRAESEANLNDYTNAANDVNVVRERAFGGSKAYDITSATLQAQPLYLLFERGREFYYEAQRRTDLVRFGQFIDGSYMWTWKGNSFSGLNLQESNMNVFPLPASELQANPNIKQNPGY